MGVNSFCEIQQCGCDEFVHEKSMSMQAVNAVSNAKSECKHYNADDKIKSDISENNNYKINYYNNGNRNRCVQKGIKMVFHVIKVKMVCEWKLFFKEMKLLRYIHNLKRIQPIYYNVSTDETTLTSINKNNNNNTQLQLFAHYKQYPSLYLGTKTKDKGKDGFGIEKWSNNSLNNPSYTIAQYVGTYSNNTANGYGVFTTYNEHFTQITSYCGEFVNAYAHGFGIYINEVKSIKTYGTWNNDKLRSIAVEEWKDGSMYEGEFHNGNKNGIGVYKWNNGSTYSGTWKNNTLHGYGIYTNASENNSFKYIGEWCNNKKEGFGLYLTLSYKHYGLYKNDKRNGFGVMLWEKHNKAYIGFWKEGSKNGIGKFITNEKSVYGVWNDSGGKEKKKIEQICGDMFYVILDNVGLGGFKKMFKFSLEEVVQFMDEILIC